MNMTSRRTKLDFAAQMKELADTHYPKAKKIKMVHTPKHSSWLNMAECKLSV
jgi:hypothetical protein